MVVYVAICLLKWWVAADGHRLRASQGMGSCRRAHIEAPRGAPAGPSLTVRFMMADNCSRFPAIQSQGRLQLYRWLISHPTRGPFGFGGDCVGLSVICASSAEIIRPS